MSMTIILTDFSSSFDRSRVAFFFFFAAGPGESCNCCWTTAGLAFEVLPDASS